MKPNYDIAYFIKKFEAIPEEDWCIDNFSQSQSYPVETKKKFLGIIPYTETTQETKKRFCAQGHCMGEIAINYICTKRETFDLLQLAKSYPEWEALINIFGVENKELIVAYINNGNHIDYQQPTPKQRILKALYDKQEYKAKSDSSSIKKVACETELILN